MYKDRIIVMGLSSFLIFSSLILTVQAEPWEFFVDVNMEDKVVDSNDTVVVTGRVIDQAYRSIRGADVLISAGIDTIKVMTYPDGSFRGVFDDFEKIPGTYTVNVIASWNGMKGLASTEFQIRGNYTADSVLQVKLSTDEAKRYLNASETDFEKNPIGKILFKYYQKLQTELIDEQKRTSIPTNEEIMLEQQRVIEREIKDMAIAEYKPSAGVYHGYRYNDYIDGLDPRIKDLVVEQLNFTKNVFEQAQHTKERILADGGTQEQARKAYLDELAMPKERFEQFNRENFDLQQRFENTRP